MSHIDLELFGAHDDGDAAELEQLRREAPRCVTGVAVSGGQRSREVQQLEARIDSLASRNAKFDGHLKEAVSSCWRCGEVDRLGQPPSGYGVMLGAPTATPSTCSPRPQDGLTCSPNIDAKTLKKGPDGPAQRGVDRRRGGQRSSLSARSVIAARGARRRPPGTGGRRHADEERIVWLPSR